MKDDIDKGLASIYNLVGVVGSCLYAILHNNNNNKTKKLPTYTLILNYLSIFLFYTYG